MEPRQALGLRMEEDGVVRFVLGDGLELDLSRSSGLAVSSGLVHGIDLAMEERSRLAVDFREKFPFPLFRKFLELAVPSI